MGKKRNNVENRQDKGHARPEGPRFKSPTDKLNANLPIELVEQWRDYYGSYPKRGQPGTARIGKVAQGQTESLIAAMYGFMALPIRLQLVLRRGHPPEFWVDMSARWHELWPQIEPKLKELWPDLFEDH